MRSLRVLSVSLCVLSLLAVTWFTVDYLLLHYRLTEERLNFAAGQTDQAVLVMRKVVAGDEAIAAGLVARVSAEHLGPQALSDLLRETMMRYPQLERAGVAYEPFAYDPARRLHAPCMVHKSEGPVPCGLDDNYDYTGRDYRWYGEALARGRFWSEPRFSERNHRLVVDYSLAFHEKGKAGPTGVVVITLEVTQFEQIIQMIDLGNRGYGFMLSAADRFMVHPVKDYTRQLMSATEVAQRDHDTGMSSLGDLARRGTSGRLDTVNAMTGQPSWLNFRVLPGSGWVLCTVYGKGELASDHYRVYHSFLHVVLASLALVLSAAFAWLIWCEKKRRRNGWISSLLVSLSFLAAIGAIWTETQSAAPGDLITGRLMTGKASVAAFTKEQTIASIEAKQEPPRFVPTGIFIQSAEFISPNNVSVSGHVWQRYTKGMNDQLRKGFILPETETSDIAPIYDWSQGDEHYMGWTFHVTLRQSFDYSNYPFDWQSIWIRMWPRDFDKNVILIPETSSYVLLDPAAMPGIEEKIVVGGWIPSASFFEYRFNDYNVNFGLPGYVGQKHFPELYFHFVIKRDFMDPFISHLTPIFLVILLIFTMLMTISKDARNRELLGFNAATIIATASALFFVALIAHIDIRSRLQTSGIFYLEYFYFISYLAILFLCVYSILFTYENRMPFVHYEDGLLPKILYWPVVTALMFGVTLCVFY